MATTKYASEYLMQYQGHNTPVNNVKFNLFVPVSQTDHQSSKTDFVKPGNRKYDGDSDIGLLNAQLRTLNDIFLGDTFLIRHIYEVCPRQFTE